MYNINECPNCKSKNISLLGTDLQHPECYLIFSANKNNKTFDINNGIPLHGYRCLNCNFISFFHAMTDELASRKEN